MSFLGEILQKLGWEDGFQIPVANAENQKLEEEVAKLTLLKVKCKTTFEASTTKLENLEDHLKYIKQECEQNQNLITAHAQQLQSEEDKLRISQAEKDKYDTDTRQCLKKISDVNERAQLQKIQLEKFTKKLDKLKSESEWDSEALKAWEESLKKRDDDNEIIKKFSKQDEQKYNELEAKRQHLEVEFANRKQTIDKMVSDLTNYERMLERTGKIMKQQVIERNALVQQWKDSVKILHQRDTDIDRIQKEILELNEIIEKEQEKLEECKLFHDNQIQNNNEVQHEAQQLNILNSKMRKELNDLTQYLLLLNSQADTIRRTMLNSAQHLEKERQSKKSTNEKINQLERKIKNAKISLDDLKSRNEQMRKSTLSADERTKQLERMIDNEQKLQKTLKSESEILQNAVFRAQQELQDQYNVAKVTEMGIYGATTNINHLRRHNDEQRKVIGKRKEDAYELDYRIDEVQRKILINENVIHSEDKEELEVKLVELENKMAECTDVKNLLKDQINRISDDMRRLTTAILADQNHLTILKDKLQHQNLNYEGGLKQLQNLKLDIQEKQVEENILRLRVDQLKKAMKKEENCIYTMQKFKLTLEQATKERLIEIDTKKDILLVKRRNLREDKGRLKLDISERQLKLEQFKKKYDIVLQSLGNDDDGQALSVTHLKIKNAQEKFLLQQEGDALDAKIKKAEKEILAMENTLKVVNLTNAAFKQSLGAVDDDGMEMNEMKALENQMLLVNDSLRDHRKRLIEKKQQLEDIQQVFKDYELKETEAKEKLFQLEDDYIRIQNEKMQKEEKLKRADNCLKLIQKKIKSKQREIYDRDLEIRQLKDVNLCVMQRLIEISVRYQEINPLIIRYTTEYDIKLPEKRSLSVSSESSRTTPSCGKERQIQTHKNGESSSSSSSSSTTNISKVDLVFQI